MRFSAPWLSVPIGLFLCAGCGAVAAPEAEGKATYSTCSYTNVDGPEFSFYLTQVVKWLEITDVRTIEVGADGAARLDVRVSGGDEIALSGYRDEVQDIELATRDDGQVFVGVDGSNRVTLSGLQRSNDVTLFDACSDRMYGRGVERVAAAHRMTPIEVLMQYTKEPQSVPEFLPPADKTEAACWSCLAPDQRSVSPTDTPADELAKLQSIELQVSWVSPPEDFPVLCSFGGAGWNTCIDTRSVSQPATPFAYVVPGEPLSFWWLDAEGHFDDVRREIGVVPADQLNDVQLLAVSISEGGVTTTKPQGFTPAAGDPQPLPPRNPATIDTSALP